MKNFLEILSLVKVLALKTLSERGQIYDLFNGRESAKIRMTCRYGLSNENCLNWIQNITSVNAVRYFGDGCFNSFETRYDFSVLIDFDTIPCINTAFYHIIFTDSVGKSL